MKKADYKLAIFDIHGQSFENKLVLFNITKMMSIPIIYFMIVLILALFFIFKYFSFIILCQLEGH